VTAKNDPTESSRQNGMADHPAHERPGGRRRDWPDRVIGGPRRGRNRVIGGLGEVSANAAPVDKLTVS
jgi:hypothetical protein